MFIVNSSIKTSDTTECKLNNEVQLKKSGDALMSNQMKAMVASINWYSQHVIESNSSEYSIVRVPSNYNKFVNNLADVRDFTDSDG